MALAPMRWWAMLHSLVIELGTGLDKILQGVEYVILETIGWMLHGISFYQILLFLV